MGANKTKVILVAGALLLFVLLFIAPKNAAHPSENGMPGAPTDIAESSTVDVFLNMALKTVGPAEKKTLDLLSSRGDFDSLASIWNKQKRPDIAAYYVEEKAKRSDKPEDWFAAGNRYYYSVQFTQDKSEVPVLYQSAIRSFKKGLKKKDDADAKIMLASCYVEGSADPMKGITMLREIEQKDSNNVKLQLSFAFFSVKSGQLDRAITRFKKVLQIDSNYIEAYLHLADAYEQQNKKSETIIMLQEYVARSPDVTARIEVNKYIQQLKESNNNN